MILTISRNIKIFHKLLEIFVIVSKPCGIKELFIRFYVAIGSIL
uniref:Uncharacterized protein n=1 Tax=Podoviridae sp. ctG4L18 TaxID=2825234 RepID=A0A8S5UNU6_9CAUD|nr:MAG TPA: hypothetical protein [Podoviridae sp. ctG4L18]